ncbi:MAG TPA: hypothetical protein VHU15_16680 [Stellaceae bacterium]|jgi:hypothetical protein|nr:hypothetical protein [Stellaceae bacterium]
MTTATQAATASEVIAIVGRLDDAIVARIIATGATTDEVLEAFTWAQADDQIGTELGHGRHGTVGEVYDILTSIDPDDFDELR